MLTIEKLFNDKRNFCTDFRKERQISVTLLAIREHERHLRSSVAVIGKAFWPEISDKSGVYGPATQTSLIHTTRFLHYRIIIQALCRRKLQTQLRITQDAVNVFLD